MPRKQIVWEPWVDPAKPLPQANINEYDDDDEPKPSYFGNVMTTPFGILPITENQFASTRFDFWIMHTNFNLTKPLVDIISKTPGVETIEVYTRYRARLGFPKSGLFNRETTKQRIEDQLQLLDNIRCQAMLDRVKMQFGEPILGRAMIAQQNASKYDYWAIYVLPNGHIDMITDRKGSNEFLQRLQILKATQSTMGGIIISSEENL